MAAIEKTMPTSFAEFDEFKVIRGSAAKTSNAMELTSDCAFG